MQGPRWKRWTATSGAACLLAAAATGAALADHGGSHGLNGLFNSRGVSTNAGSTISEFKIHDPDLGLKLTGKRSLDVVMVGAQLASWTDGSGATRPGETGWHSHPAQSLASVQPGGPALKMYELLDGRCVETTIPAGRAFVHPAHSHNFVNEDTSRVLRFGVAYFVPVGATLLTPEPKPANCG